MSVQASAPDHLAAPSAPVLRPEACSVVTRELFADPASPLHFRLQLLRCATRRMSVPAACAARLLRAFMPYERTVRTHFTYTSAVHLHARVRDVGLGDGS